MRAYLRLLATLRPYRARLLLAMLCMVVYAAMSGLSLGVVVPLMNQLFAGSGAGVRHTLPALPGALATLQSHAQAWLLGGPPLRNVGRVCMFLLGTLLLKNAADYLQSYHMVAVEQASIRDLRRTLFEHVHRLPLSYFGSHRTGMLVSRITNDLEFLRASLAAGISNLVKDSLTLFAMLVWVFAASWQLALFSMVVLPPAAWALVVIGRAMRRRSGRAQERMADVTSVLQETITGARVVKAFGMESHEGARFGAANDAFFRAFVRLRRVSAAAKPLSEFLIVCVAIGMLWFAGRQIFVQHTLDPARFVLFVTALLSTISPVKSLSEVAANVQQGIAAAHRVFDLLDTPPELVDVPDAQRVTGLRDAVRFEHVTFAYPGGEPVLHDVSFELRRGEVVALVGSSGAGKSTAMDLIPRFHDPQQGRLTWDGADLRRLASGALRAQLGIVTQETILFHETVRANIAYGRPGASEGEIVDAARAAFADDFVGRLPLGYDTVVGERGTRLSGGERQRLAIARALLRNPPLLLLDEATSALDAESERMVQAALERLMRDRTVLVIAHRLSTVQRADRIVVLERGRVVATGTHAQLLEQAGLYRRLYELQFAG